MSKNPPGMGYLPKNRVTEVSFDTYLARHMEWAEKTFGPWDKTRAGQMGVEARGPLGPLDHIKKEIVEIEANPTDGMEWVDLIILGIDGYIRGGNPPSELLFHMLWKQKKNMMREWPNWQLAEPGKAIEHVKGMHD